MTDTPENLDLFDDDIELDEDTAGRDCRPYHRA